MEDLNSRDRDLAALTVLAVGAVVASEDRWLPFDLVDQSSVRVEPVAEFLRDLQACGRSPATARSYAMDLLRWFRFLWALGLDWNRASRAEARDFCRWMLLVRRPGRADCGLAPSVRAHAETVLRGFYDFHLKAGTGPILNPFPLDRARRGSRAHAHHNPMEPYRNEKSGRFRPTVPAKIPRSVPDAEFNEIFARLGSHRDRALVAFYVSTGARASELLSVTQAGADPGRQLITVVRKGTGATQELPASSDAFVWLRLYQVQMEGLIPVGAGQPLWWTSRVPVRPLELSRGSSHVRAGDLSGGQLGDAARVAAYRRLSDG